MDAITLHLSLIACVVGLAAVFFIGCIVGAAIDRYDQRKHAIDWERGDVPYILKDQAD